MTVKHASQYLNWREGDNLEKTIFRVLVVDDFEPWRRFVSSTLQEGPKFQVIGEASDGHEGVQAAQRLRPDLILMDIGLPTLNGVEAARQILQSVPMTKILFLSEQRSPHIVEEGLRTGAGGYLIKADAGTELLPAVEAVLQGRRFVSASLTGFAGADHGEEHITPLRRLKIEHHEVRFYSNEANLVDDFAQFTKAALKVRNTVLIIASESLRNSIRQRLSTDGVDLDSVAKRRQYLSINISDPLSASTVREEVANATRQGLHVAVG